MTQVGDNFKGAAMLIRQFRDVMLGGVTLNLDGGHDSVADSIQNGVARFVSARLGVIDATFFDEEMEYGLGEARKHAR
jgi:hypothetical protein